MEAESEQNSEPKEGTKKERVIKTAKQVENQGKNRTPKQDAEVEKAKMRNKIE